MTNQQTVSSNTKFQVHYSYYAERMTSVFCGKMDKYCTFIQFLMGSAVMADVIDSWLIGFIVAGVAVYQFTCKPAITEIHAKQQAARYSELLHDLPNLTDSAVREKLKVLEEKDSVLLLSIRDASYIQSCIVTGERAAAESEIKKLNMIKRVIIFIAGGIQK